MGDIYHNKIFLKVILRIRHELLIISLQIVKQSRNGHIAWIHFCSIVNRAAMNMDVRVYPFGKWSPLGYMSGSAVGESSDSTTVSFCRNRHRFQETLYQFTFPQPVNKGSISHRFLLALIIICFLEHSHFE